MQLGVIMEYDIKTILTIVSLAGMIGSVIYFFRKVSDNIAKIEGKIESCRKALSEEHTRHDENLIERITDIRQGLEKHISQEEVESAFASESRKRVVEIEKNINKLMRNK